jgi:hypothetical protein
MNANLRGERLKDSPGRRLLCSILVGLQFGVGLPARAESRIDSSTETAASPVEPTPAPTEPTAAATAPDPPPSVTPNRTVPSVTPPSPNAALSLNPPDEEFFQVRVFAEPLVPFSGTTDPQENQELAQALQAFRTRQEPDDVSALTDFLAKRPNSRWAGSLLANLGTVYRWTGRLSKALEAWQEAWLLGRDQSDPHAKAIADGAVGELAGLRSRLGQAAELRALFAELEGRDLSGPATQNVAGARIGAWYMENRPNLAFRCGPFALSRIRAALGKEHSQAIEAAQSTSNGTSLAQMAALARATGMNLQPASRERGAEILLPAMIH